MMKITNLSIIKKLDVPAMQELVTVENPHLSFKDRTNYENYIRNINLAEFLGSSPYQKVECPFCGKAEGYISYFDKEGAWTYRCFAENETHNIIGMIQGIARCSYSRAIEYIHQVYNISYGDDSPFRRAIANNVDVLSRADFSEQYPQTAKYLGSYLPLLRKFYRALTTLHNGTLETNDGEEVVILTTQEACQLLDASHERTRVFLRWLILLGYIEAVPLAKLTPTSKDRIEGLRQECHEYAGMFIIKELDKPLLDACEVTAERLRALRLTKGNMTLKTIRALTSGRDEDYSIVSPNYSYYKRNVANNAAEEAIYIYSNILMDHIKTDGYAWERDLPQRIYLEREKMSGATFRIPVEWREVRNAVIDGCGCVAVNGERDQLVKIGINDAICGIIIIPAEQRYCIEDAVGGVLDDIAYQGYALVNDHLPITQKNRKAFRDMLETCGVVGVRLNDARREKYGIRDVGRYVEVFIDADDA